jgi:hypothetical protein
MMEMEEFKKLAGDLATLVREEIELARAEMVEKIKSAGVVAGMAAASTLMGFVALLWLGALVTVGLAMVLPLWLALTIVTLLWAGLAGALAIVGKSKLQNAAPFVPEQTIAHIKEDVERARTRSKR